MSNPEVNIPLLRKAIEWAEAEAAKPPELCEWAQEWWMSSPTSRTMLAENRAPECGTCYCIAGFIASATMGSDESFDDSGEYIIKADGDTEWVANYAANQVGIDTFGHGVGWLFGSGNTIKDVRRIAESIAGERL